MRFGLPWRVKGIHEAHETAGTAARRAGSSPNEWRNVATPQHGLKPQPQPAARTDDFSRVWLRLEDLTRRIEQIARTDSAVHVADRYRYDTGEIEDRIERLERSFSEIAWRRREPPSTLAHFDNEFVSRRLENLDGHLRRITEQIETLRRPDVEGAIRALRAELGDIGHALNEALPRHAIETLEMQVQVLAQRLADGRETGADGRTLAAIETGLTEIRDALRDLMPAESLADHNETIRALAEKIDLIVAERDPATMQQLERSIATLREMSAHVASNDIVSRLAAQVQVIADKIDHLSANSRPDAALGDLGSRIDALSRTLAERTEAETAVPERLETLCRTLSDKIGQLQTTGNGNVAVDHLEDRIVGLMQRLDASDSRLNKLDAIERGLADLLVHIEELRAKKEPQSIRADGRGIGPLAQDIAYTRKSLDAVHRRLSELFDRFDALEKAKSELPRIEAEHGDKFDFATPAAVISEAGMATGNSATPPPSPPPPVMPIVRTSVPSFAPVASPAGSRPAAAPAPSDQPLEPGSGPPRRAATPTLRIAASEAALGGVRPAAGAPASRSNFIAAARRAAQAAQERDSRAARPEQRKADAAPTRKRGRAAKAVKSALLAASVVAVVAGSYQLLGNVFDFGIFDTIENRLAANPDSDATGSGPGGADSTTVAVIPDEEPGAANAADQPIQPEPRPADVTASLPSHPATPGLAPVPSRTSPSLEILGQQSLLAPPTLTVPPPAALAPGGEVTGSVARAPTASSKAQPVSPRPPAASDRLPANIGSARLRSAAIGGDAGAAYEVAMRFVEGRGVTANLEEAAHWFERAASKGLTPAQFRYASMLEKGQGVKKDLAAAQRLYIAAAGKGHAKAMHNLAVLYAEGIEGKPDYKSAAQWFRKAAEHGVADSQYNLGVLTARGLGTERNMAESYKWFALAAAQGDKEAARRRDDVAAHLDAQTLASAQQAVKAFAAAPQPAEATGVATPPGGWDGTTQPAPDKQRAGGAVTLNAFGAGKL